MALWLEEAENEAEKRPDGPTGKGRAHSGG
jgi:hypothetical protein